MLAILKRRYLDILASVYIYNEHRGYSSLDRVLEAVRARCPDDVGFISEVEKHRADERKHYLMFRRYFENRGEMPYAVDRTCGHIDRLIKMSFGCHIDELDTGAVVADGALFSKLCRIIMLTEIRGMNQIDILLDNELVKADRALVKIFKVVERDEPSHWMPYEAWLRRNGDAKARLSERLADFWVHRSLIFAKLPLLFLDRRLPRREDWYDAADRRGPLPA
ncbi:ferritin-like domain-containing protein [Sphingosinicella rhizophila]|uniref:Ferritin-like domain-containing protein n=1 Tax=Sphingosinicella rhizophila TaxID=3050082 RepID=A0ABU3QBI2_9SPHN|nr:ferritin-like domain-containing protein [Sphingosinicella sp. GR2756]MDT9600757.1 ferritin-like domain-containing protein [Sphingosinicella sp. GR2756]